MTNYFGNPSNVEAYMDQHPIVVGLCALVGLLIATASVWVLAYGVACLLQVENDWATQWVCGAFGAVTLLLIPAWAEIRSQRMARQKMRDDWERGLAELRDPDLWARVVSSVVRRTDEQQKTDTGQS